MAFESKNKVDPAFNMSSMTDIIFLLLIFFMLTSNFVTPSGLPVNLPTTDAAKKVMPKVNVTITKDLKYFVNEVQFPVDLLEAELAHQLQRSEDGVVVLNVDRDVPVQNLITVAGIAAKLNAKVSVSALPK